MTNVYPRLVGFRQRLDEI